MEDFESFLDQAWKDHGDDPAGVARRLRAGTLLIERNEQLPDLARLITHVLGEHLGEWEQGISILDELRNHFRFVAGSESERVIVRCVAALQLAAGHETALDAMLASDQIIALALAACALNAQGQVPRAVRYFRRALEKAEAGMDKDDPANRALAVAGNNLACGLEEKAVRSQEETEFMVLAAQTGRKYWGIAGTWIEVERAEYRLAKTYLRAGDFERAFQHADACVHLCKQNGAPPLENFNGYEALALAETSRGNYHACEKAIAQMKEAYMALPNAERQRCKLRLDNVLTTGTNTGKQPNVVN